MPENTLDTLTICLKKQEALLEAHLHYHEREHQLEQKARDKAEETIDLRLEGMNELRNQITGERALYVTLPVLDARFETLSQRLLSVEKFQILLQGQSIGKTAVWALVITLIFLFLGVTGLLLKIF